jgi:hypothetical protein
LEVFVLKGGGGGLEVYHFGRGAERRGTRFAGLKCTTFWLRREAASAIN